MSNNHQKPQGTAVRVKNGRFTIQSDTGEHRTFQLKTIIGNSKKPATAFCNKMAGKRILSLLTGPDNKFMRYLRSGGKRLSRLGRMRAH